MLPASLYKYMLPRLKFSPKQKTFTTSISLKILTHEHDSMESTSLCSSFLPSSSIFSRSKPRIKGVSLANNKVYAHDKNCSGGGGGQHRVVDENMIVLRKRIHEMKMIERNYEPPENWMGWEKKYYTSYDSYICEAMGVLQAQLMNTRPSFALGVLALIALSVPTSAAVLCFRLMELTNGILAGIQHLP